MNNPVKVVFLSLCIPLAMLFLQVDHKVCFAVLVLALGVCWFAYNKFSDDENNETMSNNNFNNENASQGSMPQTEYAGMGTKDLCLQLLQKMNIENIEKDDDDDNAFFFEYLGERLSFRANNDGQFVLLYDTFWKKFPAENLEMITLARKAVNRANIEYNGFKLLYTFNEDTMWIHSNTCELLIPEIPHIESYFKQMLDHFLFAHKAFDESMYELMKEEAEKDK